tara:strand:+ start:54 stop:224 length:171 start_codon:yes stop_codon:yes gene_type:complete
VENKYNMKILIWIKREDAVSGSIKKYYTYLPISEKFQEWVQVEITQDEFVKLEDND